MDLSQVTLAQMRYAAAVDEARSFRVAAERCSVSQSGLSMQLQKLEDLLGTVLFDRTKKPVIPTPEGRAALDQIRQVLRDTERLGQILAAQGELTGAYRLAVIPTLSASILPLFLRDLVERHPRLELTIEELKTEEIIERLRADTLDAGLAATPLATPGLQETALGYEPFFAYLTRDDPLLRKKAVTEKDLRGRELWVMPEGHCFRTQVLSFCDPEARSTSPSRIHFESGSFETLMHLVDDGLGATILPALVVQRLPRAKQRAQVRPIAAPVPSREIGLVTARAELRRRVNESVVELVRARLEEALGPAPRRSVVLPPLGGE